MNTFFQYGIWAVLVPLILFSCSQASQEKDNPKQEENTSYKSVDGDLELKRIDSLLKKKPNDAELLAKRADVLFKLLRQEEGVSDISKAFRLDSTNLEVRRVHAGYMMGQLKVLDARDDYNFIIEKDPSQAEAYLGLARTYAVEGNNKKAFQLVDEALKRNIKLRDAYVLKGIMFRSEGKTDLAISSYQTAVEIDPNYQSGYIALGNLHEEINSPLAMEFYNTAIQIDSLGLDALYAKALLLQNTQKLEESKEIYRKIAALNPKYVEAYYNQGYIHLVYENQYDSATHFFKKSVELQPNYLDAWYNLGLSEQARGRNKEAIKAYKEVLKLDENFEKAKKEIDNILKMK